MGSAYWYGNSTWSDMLAIRSFQLNTSAYAVGSVFRAPITGTIDRIGAYCSAEPSAATIDVRLEDVAAGIPDGNLATTGSNVAGSPTDDTWTWYTLDTAHSATAGDYLAAILVYTAGDATFTSGVDVGSQPMFPRTVQNSGSWAVVDDIPCVVPRYASGSGNLIPQGFFGAHTLSSLGFSSTDDPNEYGVLFTPNAACSLVGAHIFMRCDNTSADFNVNVYDGQSAGATDRIVSDSYDASHVQANTYRHVRHEFSSAVSLSAGQEYRISLQPTTANDIQTRGYMTFSESTLLEAYRPGFYATYRHYTNDATWTDSSVIQPQITPILGQLTVAGGGGGLKLASTGGLAG